eukprot:Blabericola_migrator_1__7332@NODE_372_length_9256_cov_73_169986_g297_i0_p2_GENE_NODE_372_length_9256_cov_73_169986_g297_i0NODE_372_length_9256_cov_73_169986_g297_i0_p2_ORF_typecomplete_len465_score76_95Prenyltrans/PF00432_21/3_3e07Prenyltrans/PF00432_21/4_9e08Prenyltrans/PF00432_21/2_4e12Prenyltrans/PF00432_21/5_9e10Prenyltrans/PF00432_21/1_1e07SQHop_cyclase_N/PF13249_6/1_6e05SQHop_cyclase_N/PF13249_6/3_5SQHop_cyclase_N/PF13249_6/5_6e02SQHop_cyclase_N/PF13249_6/1_8e03TED_complement/PF07678_14/0_
MEVPSESAAETRRVERHIKTLYCHFQRQVDEVVGRYHVASPGTEQPENTEEDLQRALEQLKPFALEAHLDYLTNDTPFPKIFLAHESSSVWLVYWKLHSLAILKKLDLYLSQEGKLTHIFDYLRAAQHEDGGFGGAPGWIGHLSTTYAACAVLRMINTPEALAIVNKDKLYTWLLQLKCESGAFRLHEDGEIDIRGTYCALASAEMFGILTPELTSGVGEALQRCQRYDGGLSGVPGGEAHAAYTYCGLASACLLDVAHTKLNLGHLLRWLSHRQQSSVGGFNGRPNKLVDACYSFWVAACFPLLKYAMYKQAQETGVNMSVPGKGSCWFSPFPIESYVLLACQPCLGALDTSSEETGGTLTRASSIPHQGKCGGFCDKPGKSPDYYHTCYALSGLSIVRHWGYAEYNEARQDTSGRLVHNSIPDLERVCPLLNIVHRGSTADDALYSKNYKLCFRMFESEMTD